MGQIARTASDYLAPDPLSDAMDSAIQVKKIRHRARRQHRLMRQHPVLRGGEPVVVTDRAADYDRSIGGGVRGARNGGQIDLGPGPAQRLGDGGGHASGAAMPGGIGHEYPGGSFGIVRGSLKRTVEPYLCDTAHV